MHQTFSCQSFPLEPSAFCLLPSALCLILMPNPNTENDRTLQTLTRSLTQSPGRFSLILVRCNYTSLRDRIVAQVCQQCSIEIRQLTLSPSAKTLYTTIVNEFGEQPTDAVMVLGLESVMALDDLLGATNKVRDQFRSFPFPVVLWVTDRVLRQLMRVAPDFKSWAGPPLEFKLPYEELMGLLAQQAEQIFVEEPDFTVEGDELEAIEQDLSSCGQELEPELNASLALMKGLIQYRDNQLNAALAYYQQSLAFFEPSPKASKNQNPQNHNVGDVGDVGEKHLGDNSSAKPELNNPNASPSSDSFNPPPDNPPPNPLQGGGARVQGEGVRVQRGGERVQQGIVLLQLGLAYYRKGEQYWLDSRNYLQQCLNKFEEAQRQDLVAKHINQLCQVLQGLEDWKSLERLAKKALELHQSHGNPGRLVEDYSFLAEVALKKEQWQDAKQWAQQALAIREGRRQEAGGRREYLTLTESKSINCALYYLILAKSEQGLGEITKAIRNLEQAKDQTQPQHQLSLYLEILQELRSLYFEQGQYREAFYLKLEQREVESRYGLRAFVGAGRLQPPVLKREEGSQVTVAEQVEDIVAASGRQQDVERLIERVNRADCKLTVIHGQSGVGKSSILQAGLVPALEVSYFEGREAIPVFVDVYTDWPGELAKGLSVCRGDFTGNNFTGDFRGDCRGDCRGGFSLSILDTTDNLSAKPALSESSDTTNNLSTKPALSESSNSTNNLSAKPALSESSDATNNLSAKPALSESSDATNNLSTKPALSEYSDLPTILEQLRQNGQRHRLTVLIFDQFEEFFFVYKDQASRRPFYEFLRHCLEILYVKIILSLREDYLHYLLELTRTTNLEGFDDNYKHLLYYLGNFSPADAKSVIWNLTQRSQFYLEPDLVEELVKELAGEVGEVRPIELQIVGAQLQTDNITTLDQYRVTGTKDELVKQFLADVVKDCGVGNEQIANLVLYLLTDENNTRPLKTRENLELELEIQGEKLDLFLEILVKSGIVLRVPGTPAECYQLVHDYLVTFIRTQNPESARLFAELEREREQRKFTEKKLNEVLKKQLREARRGLVWSAIAGGLAMVLPWVLMGRNNIYLSSMSAESKRLMGSNKDLQALVESIKAGKRLKRWGIGVKTKTKKQVESALQEVVYTIRERNSFEGHKDSVTSVSFSPDGKLIASGSADNTVKLWSVDGKEIATFEGHKDKITSIAFSPDSQMVVSGSADNIMKLWKPEGKEGKEIASFQGHKDIITSISFSPNGQMVASGSVDKTVTLWNLEGKVITTFKEHKETVTGVAFSPDSQMVASSSLDKTIRLWSLDGKEFKTLNHEVPVQSLSFSLPGEAFPKKFGLTIISLVESELKIWRSDGSLLNTINQHKGFGERGSIIISGDGWSLISFGSIVFGDSSPQIFSRNSSFQIEGQTLAWSNYNNSEINLKLKRTNNQLKITSTTLKGHRDKVTSVSLSPDGKMLASASEDKTVKLWHLETSGFENPNSSNSVSLSPDGEILASDRTNYPHIVTDELKLWSPAGKMLKTLKGINSSISFSLDSQMLVSASMDRTVQLWSKDQTGLASQKNIARVSYSKDGQTIALVKTDNRVQLFERDGRLLTTLKGHKEKIYRVNFSPDGQTIATTSDDQTVKLWQRDGKLLTTIKGHRDRIYRVDFSPDGQTIATASDDPTVKLWQRDGSLITTLAGYSEKIQGLSFSTNGKTLALHGGDNTVKFFRQDGTLLKTVKGYGYQEMTVKFSPDRDTLAILDWGKDKNKLEIRYIDGTLLKTFPVDGWLQGFSDDGKTIVTDSDKMQFWGLDGSLLSTLEKNVWSSSFDYRIMVTIQQKEKKLKLWRRDGREISTIPFNHSYISTRAINFSLDKKTLAVQTSRNTVELWSSDGTFIKTIQIESKRFRSSEEELISLPMSFSPNSQILAIRTDDNKVELWSVDGKLIDTIQGQVDAVTDLSFVPESETLIISGYDDAVKLWQRDGTELKVFPDHSNQINRVSFSPDGKTIASVSDDKTIRLWKRDGTLIKTIDKHSDKVNDVSFSPDGKIIASASDDKTIRLWKRDGTLVKSFDDHGNGVNRVSFSPDGKLIASASEDKTVKLWSIDKKESIHTLDHDYPVTSVSFHPDGELIASASKKAVKLWSLDGEEIATFDRLGGGDVSFSPDGSIVGISDEGIALWNSDLDELLERGCNWVRDYLKNNRSVEERDGKLCDDIGTQE
ncbi:MAG: hypothetical protein F6K21_17585 [Symploca sp. SIO2D2]|nr:hypothetical protein [Symploca sp. SIO2D2]